MMEDRSRCLIFDPFSGISGDMILGGLVDLGLGSEWLIELVQELPIPVHASVTTVKRGGLLAQAVSLEPEEPQPARGLAEVLEIVEGAKIDQAARTVAAAAFRRLAEVEAALHGVPVDQVHFHEVGADDAIADIIGTAAGVAALEVESCFTRPVAVGRGWIDAQHGRLPVPAPATLKLLEGIPVIETDLEGEFTTPTGAVLLATLTRGQRAPSSFVPIRSGFGAGSRDPSTHPNCTRLLLAELDPRGALSVLQADIDDMSPEYLPSLLEALREAGAIDVWTHPVHMKKGRTGIRLELLVPEARREEVSRTLFAASTTLGLRFWRVEREVLPRATKTIVWRGFPIRVKTSYAPDGHVRYKPEYDDVVAASQATGLAPLQVRQAIERELGRQAER
jgi:uncharacterized protein (TIGR00299 family) protein